MRREEGDDGVSVGGGDGGEESGSVEGAGVEEVGGFCGIETSVILPVGARIMIEKQIVP